MKRHWFDAIAALGIRAPKRVLAVAFVFLAVFGIAGATTPINTARHTMVAEDNPHQAKQIRFFDRFGLPNAMMVVVSGGDEGGRRAVVRELSERLEGEPELAGRVLGRVGPEQLAELLFVVRPDAVAKLRQAAGGDLDPLVTGGLVGWLDATAARLDPKAMMPGPPPSGVPPDGARPLGALPPGSTPPTPPPLDPAALKKVDAQLGQLAEVLELLEREAAGEGDPWTTLLSSLGDAGPAREAGIDEAGYLVSESGKMSFVALFPELPGAQGHEVRPVVERIRVLRDEALTAVNAPGVEAKLTGTPALAVDEEGEIQKGLMTTSAFTGLAIMILLWSAFRSIRYTLLALVPTAVGVAATMAVARAIYGELNMVTSSCASVLLALGIDFGVVLLSRYGEQVRGGDDATDAIKLSVRRAGMGLFVGAITTATAFLTTTTTEFTAYARLGVIVALGLLIMMAFTLVLMPALLWVAGRGEKMTSPELSGVGKLPPLLRAGRWGVIAVAALLVAGSLSQVGTLSFNTRFYDFIPDEGESASALLAIERDPVATPLLATAFAEGVEPTRQLAAELEALDTVDAVRSATDMLPELSEDDLETLRAGLKGGRPPWDSLAQSELAAPALDAALARLVGNLEALQGLLRLAPVEAPGAQQASVAAGELRLRLKEDGEAAGVRLTALQQRAGRILGRAWDGAAAIAERGGYAPSDLPGVFGVRYTSVDGQALALYVVPKGDIWDPATAARFAETVSAVAPNATGMAMHVDAHLTMIKEGFTRAALLAAGLVLLVLLIAFRSLFDASLALVPTLVGFTWMLGAMALFDLSFDAANIVTLPLIIGVGVDAGVHLVHRMRQSAEENGGTASLQDVVVGTGGAVALASLTTAAGFASLMLADYGAMQSLGLAMTLGIAATLLSSIVVLPSLMLALGKAR